MTRGQPQSSEDFSPGNPDWKNVAGDRLAKLVELEHDYTVVRDRLVSLQNAHHQEAQRMLTMLTMLQSLRRERDALADELMALSAMQASILSSRSWRITQPLRDATILARRSKQYPKRALRRLLDVPMFRRVARRAGMAMPGLARRMHTLLYGNH